MGYQFEYQGEKYNVKTILYADDICTLLPNQGQYLALQSHLKQCSLVSNTKFNRNKTEASSINGQKDYQWQAILAQADIHTYHTEYSIELFRYLGFYVTYIISLHTRSSISQNKVSYSSIFNKELVA